MISNAVTVIFWCTIAYAAGRVMSGPGGFRPQRLFHKMHISKMNSQRQVDHDRPDSEISFSSSAEPSHNEPKPNTRLVVIHAIPKPEPERNPAPDSRILIVAQAKPQQEPKPEPLSKLPRKFTLILNDMPNPKSAQPNPEQQRRSEPEQRHSPAIPSESSLEKGHGGTIYKSITHENTIYKDSPNVETLITVKEEIRVKPKATENSGNSKFPVFSASIFPTPVERPQKPEKVSQSRAFPGLRLGQDHQQPKFPIQTNQQQMQEQQIQFQQPANRLEPPRFGPQRNSAILPLGPIVIHRIQTGI